jgi:hypothetical protein
MDHEAHRSFEDHTVEERLAYRERHLGEIYDSLPLTERTLLKRIKANVYPFKLLNDTGETCDYRVIDEIGIELGLITYRCGGRKLACFELVQKVVG